MRSSSRIGSHLTAVLLLLTFSAEARGEDWLSWAGPRSDFTVAAGRLAEEWPSSGPPRLWERPLGGGYSAILVQDGRLFTMYRDGQEDVLVGLEGTTGATVWEHRDTYAIWPDMEKSFGLGPNTTPLLIAGRLVGVGISGRMRAVEADTGKLVWLRDLPSDFGRRKRVEEYGYSGNPLAWDGKVLTQVGGDETAVVAFEAADGSVVWKSAPGGVSYGAPTLRRLAGRDHYVYFEPEGVVGLDPATGETLWRHPIELTNGNHLTPVVPCGDNHLWVSSQFDSGGGRLLEITAAGDGLEVEEHWFTTRLQASHWPLHCQGDFVYGSIGGNSSSRLAAVRWKTGEIAWQKRGFHKAQSLWADGKLLFLDEDGDLTLARVSPQGIEILANATVAEDHAWTLPTLVGTTLYVRDQEKVLALDLSAPPAAAVAAEVMAAAESLLTVRQAELLESQPDVEGPDGRRWTIRQTDVLRVNLVEMRGEVPRHVHPDTRHSLMVLKGEVRVHAGDKETVLGEGDFVSIPRGLPHHYVVVGESALLVSMDAPDYDPAKTVLVDR